MEAEIIREYKLNAADNILKDYIANHYAHSELVGIVSELHLLLTLWVSNREGSSDDSDIKAVFQHLEGILH